MLTGLKASKGTSTIDQVITYLSKEALETKHPVFLYRIINDEKRVPVINIPFGAKGIDIPCFMYLKPNGWLYICRVTLNSGGFNGTNVTIGELCGICKVKENGNIIYGGPMFHDDWIVKKEDNGFSSLDLNIHSVGVLLYDENFHLTFK